jgi:hypothetical protein
MFALTPDDLSGSILDCATGPASFNAELSAEGRKIISCDPLYRLTVDEIRARIGASYDTRVTHVRTASDEFVWREFAAPENLGESRPAAVRIFLADFPQGMKEERYMDQSLTHLGFREGEFDIALCSHFLFTYSDQLSVDFHVAAIEEMCRDAAEARVFPLLKSTEDFLRTWGRRWTFCGVAVTRLRSGEFHTSSSAVETGCSYRAGSERGALSPRCGSRLANMVRVVAQSVAKEARTCSASLASGEP